MPAHFLFCRGPRTAPATRRSPWGATSRTTWDLPDVRPAARCTVFGRPCGRSTWATCSRTTRSPRPWSASEGWGSKDFSDSLSSPVVCGLVCNKVPVKFWINPTNWPCEFRPVYGLQNALRGRTRKSPLTSQSDGKTRTSVSRLPKADICRLFSAHQKQAREVLDCHGGTPLRRA
jgi:hypothetical protein